MNKKGKIEKGNNFFLEFIHFFEFFEFFYHFREVAAEKRDSNAKRNN